MHVSIDESMNVGFACMKKPKLGLKVNLMWSLILLLFESFSVLSMFCMHHRHTQEHICTPEMKSGNVKWCLTDKSPWLRKGMVQVERPNQQTC